MFEWLIDLALELAEWYRRGRFSSKDRSSFYSKLGMLTKNGLTLKAALTTLHNVFSEGGTKPNKIKAIVAEECLAGQRAGKDIASTLVDWVPYEEAATIAAGARSEQGQHEALLRARQIVKRKAEMRKLMTKALSYPTMLWVAMGGLLYYTSKTVMPNLIRMTKPESWDVTAQIMSVLANIVGVHGELVLLVVFSVIGAVIWSIGHVTGLPRVYLDRLPPWSIVRTVRGATFLYNFGVLQASGDKAITILHNELKHANAYMRERVEGAIMGVKNGKNIGEALHMAGHEFPSREAIEYLRVIAPLNGGPEQMMEFAEDWMADSMEQVEAIAAMLGNLSLIAVFGVMGFLLSGAGAIGMQAMGSMGQ
ncbi:type II secretion system F family protein [Burkholderia sp. Tr-20390]|uniref:type II secretion system F family protein n=1 Tax=Burkholderia sp. Tr-20390 TaxID=2703904 RepID=UPI00197FE7BD|nr:type II secretion system F family protein [Burkholderia sp. Tr-20390]MBN3729337.1 type II secretion system protein [Burkholderia sp. Tr-20390]